MVEGVWHQHQLRRRDAWADSGRPRKLHGAPQRGQYSASADAVSPRSSADWQAAQSRTPGLFAASRIGADGREILVAFNTSTEALVAQVEVEATALA